jgi:L-alanine-DL-glutamate epimerase-like enolase superfamily enzyme
MRIVSVHAQSWTLPLVAPFIIAARTAHEARNVQIRIETESGLKGAGAAAPVGYVTGESVESVLAALEAVGPKFHGQPLDRLQPLLSLADTLLRDAPAARAGLEMALYDLWARHWDLPLWQHFGGAQTRLTTDLTIPLVAPSEAAELACSAWAGGFRSLKIKVGDAAGHEADWARIEAITKAVPGIRLRIDANQAFAPDEAVVFAQMLSASGAIIDLLEQPVPKEDIAGLKYVRERTEIPVFADEAARSVPEVLHLLREDAVDGINVKLMKSGIGGTLQIIALCRVFGKKLMLGCMLETGMGIAAAAHIAAGTGAFDYLDLDSHRLLKPIDGLSGGFSVAGEELRMPNSPTGGWGVTLPNIREHFLR